MINSLLSVNKKSKNLNISSFEITPQNIKNYKNFLTLKFRKIAAVFKEKLPYTNFCFNQSLFYQFYIFDL